MGKFDITKALAAAGASAESIAEVESNTSTLVRIPISFRPYWQIWVLSDKLAILSIYAGKHGFLVGCQLVFDAGKGQIAIRPLTDSDKPEWVVTSQKILEECGVRRKALSYRLLELMLAHMDEPAQPMAA